MKLKFLRYILIFNILAFSFGSNASENKKTKESELLFPDVKSIESIKNENVLKQTESKQTKITQQKKEKGKKDNGEEESINIYGSKKFSSLFFTSKELEDLISVVRSTKLKADSFQDSFSLVNVTEGQEEISTVIFLNSILFLSKDNWTIWVNDKKITSSDVEDVDLKVISLTQSRVKFFWQVGRTKWEIMMPNFNFENSISKLTDNNMVETTFTLEPNQTFIPQTGEIIEGRKLIRARDPIPQQSTGVLQQGTQKKAK